MAAMSVVFCVSWDCVKTKNVIDFILKIGHNIMPENL